MKHYDNAKMTEDEKWLAIEQLEEKYRCEDSAEVKEMVLALNEGVSDKARRIQEESIIIDALQLYGYVYGWRLKAAKATAINVTVPTPKDDPSIAIREIIDYYTVIDDNDKFKLILTPDDILDAKKNGQTGIIIGAQSCEFVQHHEIVHSVRAFQKLGLRIMCIAYNFRTFAADGCFSPANAGLSDTGIALIRAMEKEHVTVDLSHVGERSTLEALEMAEKPQIFSHANPVKLFKHPRNITEEQAKKCAATGGVIGVSAYPVTLFNGDKFPTIDTYIDCIAYYCDLLGPEHVGLGTDTLATEGAYPRRDIRYFNKLVRRTVGERAITYKSFEAGRGCLGYNVEGFMCLANVVRLIDRMLERGFTEPDLKKILGENWLRVFRATW